MIQFLDHINLSVADFATSVEFYRRVFEFELVEEGVMQGRPWGIIKSGEALLCLYENQDLTFVSRHDRNQHGVNHFSLRITDETQWLEKVQKEKLPINYGGPVQHPHSKAWYLNDPTGYEIEVAYWLGGKSQF